MKNVHFRNVVSLFDGMSCGQLALMDANIDIDNYYASEVDKYAIQIAMKNFPNTIQLGDVTKWRDWDVDWSRVDLLIGGSPCQGFSFAGQQLAFDDPRSMLFFCFVDILEHIRKVNPNVKFLLENVKMKKEFQDVITGFLGVSPVLIDSALVSAQTRKRLYWANWKFEQPEDMGVFLKDILEKSIDDNFVISEKASRRIIINPRNRIITDENLKAGALMAVQYKMGGDMLCKAEPVCVNSKSGRNGVDGLQPSLQDRIYSDEGKMPAVTTSFHPYVAYECKNGEFKVIGGFTEIKGKAYKIKLPDGVYVIRKLTPVECERLQTMPDGYTECVSDSRRYHALGNGWTKEVIRHILASY